MVAKSEYDSGVKRLNSATVAGLAGVLAAMVLLATSVMAQINGTPSSVTSTNFGGHFDSTPGVPASVTSLGPNGVQPNRQFFTTPNCCINPLAPVNPNPPLFQRHPHHRQNSFFPAGGAIYVPYPVVVDPEQADAAPEPNPNTEDDYRGGPTIFDRRGPGQPARPYVAPYSHSANRGPAETESAAAPAETPVADQPETVLVFKDGHKVEVQNYAVVGDVLYDLTPGHHRKIPIVDLDLNATTKQNDDLGVNFQLPPGSETSK
jgi:hypothetical protein